MTAAVRELVEAARGILAYTEDDNPGARLADAHVGKVCDRIVDAIAAVEREAQQPVEAHSIPLPRVSIICAERRCSAYKCELPWCTCECHPKPPADAATVRPRNPNSVVETMAYTMRLAREVARGPVSVAKDGPLQESEREWMRRVQELARAVFRR